MADLLSLITEAYRSVSFAPLNNTASQEEPKTAANDDPPYNPATAPFAGFVSGNSDVGGCGVSEGAKDVEADIVEFSHPYGYDKDNDGYYSTGYKQWEKEKSAYEMQYGTTVDVEGCEPYCDCDDADPAIYPGAEETCNNKDDNCDGQIDEGFPPKTPEVCDNIDNNCDGQIDEDDICFTYYYCDKDQDLTFNQDPDGSCNTPDCIPNNCVNTPGSDCDDNEVALSPLNKENVGDGIDNNCNGFIDEIDVNGSVIVIDVSSAKPAYIHIYNGGALHLTSSAVTFETDTITIEEGSAINISGVTCGDGDGENGTGGADGGGAGGASHIGTGGAGGNGGWVGKGGAAGTTYGAINDFFTEPGSCGGYGASEGGGKGSGGGALTIIANEAHIYGSINANGTNGYNGYIDGGGGSGAAGGGLYLIANKLFTNLLSTNLSAVGGKGGTAGLEYAKGGGGGGGGGGSIEITYGDSAHIGDASYSPENYPDFINTLLDANCIHLEGGTGGVGYQDGADGEPGAVNTVLP